MTAGRHRLDGQRRDAWHAWRRSARARAAAWLRGDTCSWVRHPLATLELRRDWRMAPAPAEAPVPYWPAYYPVLYAPAPRGAVRAGQGQAAAPPASPGDAATTPAPAEAPVPEAARPPGAAAAAPAPACAPSGDGPGQHPRRDTRVVFPDDQAWNSHRRRIDGLAAPARCRTTGAMPVAAVRPYQAAHEAWRDEAAVTL